MKKNYLFFLLISVLTIGIFPACHKEVSYEVCISDHQPKIANAGADQVIYLPIDSALLDGNLTKDPDGNLSYYSWTKISGANNIVISNAVTAKTLVKHLVTGLFRFELKVTDNDGLSSTDTVEITVLDSTPPDHSSTIWTKLKSLPEEHFFFGVINWWFNGYNFLFGVDGKVFGVSMNGSVWEYEVFTNNWVSKGSFPEKMNRVPIVFAINGKVYCIGNSSCWEFDPATLRWTRKMDPPNKFGDPLIISNVVYLRGTSDQLIVYNPVSDTYSNKTNMPKDLDGLLGSIVLNGKGYYVGSKGQCWQYNPATDSWLQKASFDWAESVINTSSFSLNNYGYIIGDLNRSAYNENQLMKLWRYNPSIDQWIQHGNYPGMGVYFINTVSFNGFVYTGLGVNNGDFNAIDFWSFNE